MNTRSNSQLKSAKSSQSAQQKQQQPAIASASLSQDSNKNKKQRTSGEVDPLMEEIEKRQQQQIAAERATKKTPSSPGFDNENQIIEDTFATPASASPLI